MKKVLFLIIPAFLIACGDGEAKKEDKKEDKKEVQNEEQKEEKKEPIVNKESVDLTEYGLDATISVGIPTEIKATALLTEFEQKLYKKTLEIKCDNGNILEIQEVAENQVAKKLELAKNNGDEIIESSATHFILIEKRKVVTYVCSMYFEKDGSWIEVRVTDSENWVGCMTKELALEGLAMAKTFKFK